MKNYLHTLQTKKVLTEQKGQSLVEFAISLTVILYLLVGAVEFGIALFQYVQLRDAAQEGALYGSLHPRSTEEAAIRWHVRNASTSPIDLSDTNAVPNEDIIICVSTPDNPYDRETRNCPTISEEDRCEGSAITVDITYDHEIFLPFVTAFVNSGTIPIRGMVTDTVLMPLCSP